MLNVIPEGEVDKDKPEKKRRGRPPKAKPVVPKPEPAKPVRNLSRELIAIKRGEAVAKEMVKDD